MKTLISYFISHFQFIFNHKFNNITIRPAFIVLLLVLMTGLLLLIYRQNVDLFFIRCPFNYLTGYQCPGCGSQRAVYELLHLNFRKAFVLNPLVIITILYFGFLLLSKTTYIRKKIPQLKVILVSWKTLAIAILVIILFGVLRNF